MRKIIIILTIIIAIIISPLVFLGGTIFTKNKVDQTIVYGKDNLFIQSLNNFYTLVIQIGLVITSMFVVLATLLPKVDDERQFHYKNLNNHVFIPLSTLSLQRKHSEFPLFNSFITLPTKFFYKQALHHLKKDKPEVKIESKLKNLNELIEENNEKSIKLTDEIDDIINIEF